jgi:hypothetical protein
MANAKNTTAITITLVSDEAHMHDLLKDLAIAYWNNSGQFYKKGNKINYRWIAEEYEGCAFIESVEQGKKVREKYPNETNR